jgi:N-glycosylase/DNA lyase
MDNPHFDVNVHDTINSGQIFLWENYKDVWFVINGQNVIVIRQNPSEVLELSDEAKKIFRNDDDFKDIVRSISRDKIVKNAVKQYPGLRVTRQEPFQCYISFIVSANSNIPNIRLGLQKLCRKFGAKTYVEKREFFVFPTPQILARATMSDLLGCGLGYRAKYVKSASHAVVSEEIDFDYLKKTKYQIAKESLLKIPGIGGKVADCILLFSLEKLEAFPLDTWMTKIMQKYYSNKFSIGKNTITKKRYERIHQEVIDYFGNFAGYSQQFLFKMERDLNEKKWL